MLQGVTSRKFAESIQKSLKHAPVTAILGPRQCGKTTLVKSISEGNDKFILLDLERQGDLNLLQDVERFCDMHSDKTICLDEIQNAPELFPMLRCIIDKNRRNGMFIILGSASPNLLRQSSESLAGRIRYIEMTPFQMDEVREFSNSSDNLWSRGGFPLSFLADSDEESFDWRENYIRTFLERDIVQLGFNAGANQMRRIWTMFAHYNAAVLNRSKIGESLGVSHHTVNHYIDILVDTFMLRVLPPLEANLKKRLVKSPKILFRDNGVLHYLLNIKNYEELFAHPYYGASYESFAIEQILSGINRCGRYEAYFYRSHKGEEIDLILDNQKELVAVEIKSSTAPHIAKGFFTAIEELKIKHAFIAAPVERVYPAGENVLVCGLEECIERVAAILG
ncbi:MAG: ATP-binding protein [Chitinispirillia bacterium]|nr:ATP-binding protein [Chitinispirillia bacterium]MCL2268631.1 ATP-binding protein [Chitinispirillia bacterium]